MIVVERFTKRYEERVAVDALDMTVAAGQVVGLAGPNGAGKTTTLRAITGILRPTAGRITVDGHDVVAEPVAAKRALAFVPDDPPLFPSLTVWEHLVLASKLYGLRDWEARAMSLLERFELADRRDTLADELSRGMRQKTAVCAALVHEPRALLLDEPLTGLDPAGMRSLFAAIREAAAAGAAVLLSSHLLEVIEGICSRFVFLRGGRLLMAGTLAELHARFPHLPVNATLEDVFIEATGAGTPPGA